jgi:hypothetical protein
MQDSVMEDGFLQCFVFSATQLICIYAEAADSRIAGFYFLFLSAEQGESAGGFASS